jgi:hypothetical protein
MHCKQTFMDLHHSLKWESATDAILKIHYISTICRNDSKLSMRMGETSGFKPSKLRFSIFVNG